MNDYRIHETTGEVIYLNRIGNPFAEEYGYVQQTTFWTDFSIAERFGVKAVKDTYQQAFDEWGDQYVYLTELVLVLNWKIWQYYQTNLELAGLYQTLWEQTDAYACKHLKGKELSYFYRTTD